MRIVGLLTWFDEQPSMLATSVAGLGRVADTIVACDGAYALFPGGRARSHPDQSEAILRAAETADTELVLHRPRTVYFDNEVEKRNMTVRLASAVCRPGDWLLVWDADYHLLQAKPETIQHDLEQTDLNAATYTLVDSQDLLANPGTALHAQVNGAATEWTYRTRCIYRWTPDLEYGPAHYCVRGTYNGVREWVWGPDMWPEHQHLATPCLHLNDALVAYHRRDERAKVRRDASDEYHQRKAMAKTEEITPETIGERCVAA